MGSRGNPFDSQGPALSRCEILFLPTSDPPIPGEIVYNLATWYDRDQVKRRSEPRFEFNGAEARELPLLSQQWVYDNLPLVIRDLSVNQISPQRRYGPPQFRHPAPIAAQTVWAWLRREEERAIARCRARLRTKFSGSQVTLIDRVLGVLTDPELGDPVNDSYRASIYPDLAKHVELAVEKGVPLHFVVPGLPFKSQCELRTLGKAAIPDLGEIALLLRLNSVSQVLKDFHDPGADWIIASDGQLFAQMLGLSNSVPSDYHDSLREYRNNLGLIDTIHIIDINNIMALLDRDGLPRFQHILGEIRSFLDVLRSLDDVRNRLDALSKNMLWHLPIQKLTAKSLRLTTDSRMSLAWQILQGDWGALSTRARKYLEELRWELAIGYAAVQLTVNYLGVFARALPEAIRATTRAKPQQVAIPKLGELLPWNGTAFLDEVRDNNRALRIVPIYKLFDHQDVGQVRMINQSDPLFFLAQRQS